MPKSNLSAMSVDALIKLREDINKILDHKGNELRRQLSMLGDTVCWRTQEEEWQYTTPSVRSSGERGHVSKKVKFGCQRELRFTDVGAI
jgi:hypothetical protein